MDIKNKIKDNMNRGVVVNRLSANVKEKDYFIHPNLKREMDGIICTLKNIEDFGTKMGNRNYIFTGPPGTGKTLGALYIATALNFPVYDGKMIMNSQNVSAMFKQLRQQVKVKPKEESKPQKKSGLASIFEGLKEKPKQPAKSGQPAKSEQPVQYSPVILLINELDKFSSREEIVDPNQQQTLNQLLDELEGTESNNGIFVFGTTNKPNKIDSALRRPGRFSKEVYFMPPDRKGRLAILKIHAHGKGEHKFKVENKDLEHAAEVTYGYTGADLVGLLNEAFTNARLDDRTEVNQEDIEYALTKTKPSAIRDMPFVEPKVKLKDVGGYADHKELLRKILDNGKGATILLFGPRGTAKTLIPEAFAGEFGYNYLLIHGNAPEEGIVGGTKKELEKIIDRAKQLAPCILNFDEIGSLVSKKVWTGGTKEAHTGYLQSILTNPPDDVYIFATENNPDLLHDSFIDRFVYRLHCGMPTPKEQEKIWKIHLPKGKGDYAKDLVKTNAKLSGRDISHACEIVSDWGANPEIEVYKHMIQNIDSESEINYEKAIKKIGDSVKDYRGVKDFIEDKNESRKKD